MNITLFTDSCCDLSLNYIKDNNINFVPMSVILNGSQYKDDFGETFNTKEFFSKLRQGLTSTTSQINANEYYDAFKPFVEKGDTIIYIGFSSSLSGSLNSSNIAKDMLLEEYPDANIVIIDSKSASSGEGLLVYYVNEMIKSGKSLEEIIEFIDSTRLKIAHYFTVDDLNHLRRGGRISNTSAVVGSLLSIKPILYVNDEGKLLPVSKAKGRKKSIKTLATQVEKFIVNSKEQVVFICHGDCPSDAQTLKNLIIDKVNVQDVVINSVGPTIGSHVGPGMLGVFFIARAR